MQYLLGTLDRGLHYLSTSPLQLLDYIEMQMLIGLHAKILNTSLISWKCMKQKKISKSSRDGQFRFISSIASEIIWLCSLVQDLSADVDNLKSLHVNSTGTI